MKRRKSFDMLEGGTLNKVESALAKTLQNPQSAKDTRLQDRRCVMPRPAYSRRLSYQAMSRMIDAEKVAAVVLIEITMQSDCDRERY